MEAKDSIFLSQVENSIDVLISQLIELRAKCAQLKKEVTGLTVVRGGAALNDDQISKLLNGRQKVIHGRSHTHKKRPTAQTAGH